MRLPNSSLDDLLLVANEEQTEKTLESKPGFSMAFETNKMEENIPPQFEEGLTESVEVCSENELLKSYTLESSF